MEHPELGAWVTLPPRLDFWAGCSSTLCPPVAGVSAGGWVLGRPFLAQGCVCSLGDEGSPCVLLFATFSLACASCRVSSFPSLSKQCGSSRMCEVSCRGVPQPRWGHLRALPLNCMEKMQLLAGW